MGDKELLNRARNDKSAKESELSHRESCQQGCPVSLYRVYGCVQLRVVCGAVVPVVTDDPASLSFISTA